MVTLAGSMMRGGGAGVNLRGDFPNLRPGDAREPFQEILDPRPALQILKERPNRHPSSAENPRPTHFPWNSLHRDALAPIRHAWSLV